MNVKQQGESAERSVADNLPKYFIFVALKGFGFGLIVAMWIIYLQQRRGFSLSQATVIDIAFWVAATLGEVPTGIVADTFGRKTSLAVGTLLMGLSNLAWALAPTVPLIMLTYAGLAIGVTFLSGAEDAFLYESIQRAGRAEAYTRLVGRGGAILIGAAAVGNVASGLLATVDLILPFLVASVSLLAAFGMVLTFQEPRSHTGENVNGEKTDGEKVGESERKSYQAIVRQSLALLRHQPTLRYPLFCLALIPLVAIMLETVFVLPQAIKLGVPLAAVGLVVMSLQLASMGGSTWSDRLQVSVGENRLLYSTPPLIIGSLLLLAAFQFLPALICVAVISFVTAVLRPLLLNRIQHAITDDIRATVLSMQSLLFTFLLAVSEPFLGVIADQRGLPVAYVVLAGGWGLLVLLLFWKSRETLPRMTLPEPSSL